MCVSEPQTLIQVNGAIPIHIVPTAGEPFTSIIILNESHQVSVWFNYSLPVESQQTSNRLEFVTTLELP